MDLEYPEVSSSFCHPSPRTDQTRFQPEIPNPNPNPNPHTPFSEQDSNHTNHLSPPPGNNTCSQTVTPIPTPCELLQTAQGRAPLPLSLPVVPSQRGPVSVSVSVS